MMEKIYLKKKHSLSLLQSSYHRKVNDPIDDEYVKSICVWERDIIKKPFGHRERRRNQNRKEKKGRKFYAFSYSLYTLIKMSKFSSLFTILGFG